MECPIDKHVPEIHADILATPGGRKEYLGHLMSHLSVLYMKHVDPAEDPSIRDNINQAMLSLRDAKLAM